ncbi:hypothetical protein IHE45_08G077600 [Dioscorea alata]|uniref:Uncharacterized protein n=1 Tax=Dioscorea alata TaxID=55571 RepID=A0ACB7VK89_DIOAL|nr:hypothetical protein IHE45_08G077600 [Dioscorea alata]
MPTYCGLTHVISKSKVVLNTSSIGSLSQLNLNMIPIFLAKIVGSAFCFRALKNLFLFDVQENQLVSVCIESFYLFLRSVLDMYLLIMLSIKVVHVSSLLMDSLLRESYYVCGLV